MTMSKIIKFQRYDKKSKTWIEKFIHVTDNNIRLYQYVLGINKNIKSIQIINK